MAGPLGALLMGPTASTTEIEEYVDGGGPGGATSGSGSIQHQG
jgi:hypothetical protein